MFNPYNSPGMPCESESQIESPRLAAVWALAQQQAVFRRLMDAFAYPGRIQRLPGERIDETTLGVLATLVDGSVTLADPHNLLPAADWSRLEAKRSSAEQARFILARGDSAPAFTPPLGSLESPHEGATLLLQVSALGEGLPLCISGPGVDGEQLLCVSGLDPTWLTCRESWNAGFPMGVDLLLVSPTCTAALPRSSRIKIEGAA